MLVRDLTDLDLAELSYNAARRYWRRRAYRFLRCEPEDLAHDCFIALRSCLPKRADEDLAVGQLAAVAYLRVLDASRRGHPYRSSTYRKMLALGEEPAHNEPLYAKYGKVNPHCDRADDLDRLGELEDEDLVGRLVCCVTPRERRVLLLYFTEGLELKAIGRLFGRSEAWASLTRTSALDKMLTAARRLR